MESLILKKQIEDYEEQAMSEKPKAPSGMEGLAEKQSEMLHNTSKMMRSTIEIITDAEPSFLKLIELPHKSYKRLMRHFWRKMLPYAAKTPGMNSNLYTGMVCGEGSITDFLTPIIKEYYNLDDKEEVETEIKKELEAERKRKEAEEKRKQEDARRKEMNNKADAIATAKYIEKYGEEPSDKVKDDRDSYYCKSRREAMNALAEEETARKKEEAKARAKRKRAEEKAKEEQLMQEIAAIEDVDERKARINSLADTRFFETVKNAETMDEDTQQAKVDEIKGKIEKAVNKILKKTSANKKETNNDVPETVDETIVDETIEDESTEVVETVNEEIRDNALIAHEIAKEHIYAQEQKYPLLSDKDKAIANIEPCILARLDNGEDVESIKLSLAKIREDESEETSKESNIVDFNRHEVSTSNETESDETFRSVLEQVDRQMSIFDFI